MTLPKKFQRLVGSKWTSTALVEGWRHFEVVELKRDGAGWLAQLVATCDARNVRPVVPAAALFRREQWSPGWTPLKDLVLEADATATPAQPAE